MVARATNTAETKCYSIGANYYGQCGVLGSHTDVREIPIDNLHSGNFRKNQEEMERRGHKWNAQFKRVLVPKVPEGNESKIRNRNTKKYSETFKFCRESCSPNFRIFEVLLIAHLTHLELAVFTILNFRISVKSGKKFYGSSFYQSS